MTEKTNSEAKRLEQLWSSDFGDDYIERNRHVGDHRGPFWQELLRKFPCETVLEVGCNLGGNLRWIAEILPPQNVYGVDINLKALDELHRLLPGVNALWSPARELPFRDRWFDMVFTMGVLIHVPEAALPLVMAEVVRCARKYVMCTEYYAEKTIELNYRGHDGALFKRDYAALYLQLFPQLKLLKQGFLSRAEGWDDVTYWVFEKA